MEAPRIWVSQRFSRGNWTIPVEVSNQWIEGEIEMNKALSHCKKRPTNQEVKKKWRRHVVGIEGEGETSLTVEAKKWDELWKEEEEERIRQEQAIPVELAMPILQTVSE